MSVKFEGSCKSVLICLAVQFYCCSTVGAYVLLLLERNKMNELNERMNK